MTVDLWDKGSIPGGCIEQARDQGFLQQWDIARNHERSLTRDRVEACCQARKRPLSLGGIPCNGKAENSIRRDFLSLARHEMDLIDTLRHNMRDAFEHRLIAERQARFVATHAFGKTSAEDQGGVRHGARLAEVCPGFAARIMNPTLASGSARTCGDLVIDRTEDEALDRALREIGQCVVCSHARKLTSAKGSDFYRCGKAKDDTRLSDYPPLPVVGCHAFEELSAS